MMSEKCHPEPLHRRSRTRLFQSPWAKQEEWTRQDVCRLPRGLAFNSGSEPHLIVPNLEMRKNICIVFRYVILKNENIEDRQAGGEQVKRYCPELKIASTENAFVFGILPFHIHVNWPLGSLCKADSASHLWDTGAMILCWLLPNHTNCFCN